jgi:hypothetical protein
MGTGVSEIVYEGTGELSNLPAAQQQIILASEYLQFVLNKPVTIGALAEALNISTNHVQDVLLSSTVIEALRARGIDIGSSNAKEKQMAFLLSMFNPLDTRSHRQIMIDLGVTLSEFYGWNHSNEFKTMMNRVANDFYSSAGMFVDRALITKAMSGNVQAMRLYYDQKNSVTESPKLIIQRLIEVVQKNVSDPEAQRRIGEELINSVRVVKGAIDHA